jgi:putative heme transporter
MEQSRQVHVPISTIVKILLVAVAVWALLKLGTLIAVVLVSIVIAIACDPVVEWLERRRVPRSLGAMLVVLSICAALIVFVTFTGTSMTSQGRQVLENLLRFRQTLADALPRPLARIVRGSGTVNSDAALVIGAVVVAFLTVYLLIEGRMTWAWLVAYVPPRNRGKVAETAAAAREAVLHYVVGNVLTSIFAAVVVFVALSALRVPAALLLAALAGVCDFVPVLGFIVSAVPAVLLALTVSGATAVVVSAVYVGYHAAENYLIAPRVYGNRLRLSNLAVLIAFAVGAELFGVIGALLALPVAATYPCIENIWLRDYLARDTAEGHRRIERRGA